MSGAARFGRYMSWPVIEEMAKDRGIAAGKTPKNS